MRHIPNILSWFRISLIPLLVYLVIRGELFWAAIVLIVSAITDLLDGFLARKFDWTSQVGKALDPLADKLTQITVCALFVVFFPQFWGFFAFLILKELVMLVIGVHLYRKGTKIDGSRVFGKVTTTLFYLSVIVIALLPNVPAFVVYVLLTATIGFAIAAIFIYAPMYRKKCKAEKEAAIAK